MFEDWIFDWNCGRVWREIVRKIAPDVSQLLPGFRTFSDFRGEKSERISLKHRYYCNGFYL